MKKNDLSGTISLLCLLISLLSLNRSSAQEKKQTLILKPENEAYVLRCFSTFDNKVKPHSIAVGDPSGVNYMIDAENGSLLRVWKGEFVDVAPMWLNRGGGFFKTSAPIKDISNDPPFAILKTGTDQWPDSAAYASTYKFKGYKLDKSGNPTFHYLINKITVEDKFMPAENKESLTREIQVTSDNDLANFYVLLAEGSSIKKTSKNTYSVGGKNYSIVLNGNKKIKPIIRESGGRKELLVELQGAKQASINYSITL